MTWTLDSTGVTMDSTAYTMDGGTPGLWSANPAANAAVFGQLTAFASVILAGPLYTGLGGVLDGYLWPTNVPQIGDTVWYDPTFMTVATDGSVTATSNNFSAVIQFNDGTGWYTAIYVVQPGWVSYLQAQSSMSATLSGNAAQLTANLNAVASLTGQIQTAILLSGTPTAVSALTGQLTTAIQLATQAAAIAQLTASLTTNINLQAQANALASLTGSLVTKIQLLSQPAAQASLGASLTTRKQFAANPDAIAGLSGTLTTAVRFAATVDAIASMANSLSTQIKMVASPRALSSMAAALTNPKPLAANPGAIASLTGQFRTGSGFQANPAALASMAASLSTRILLVSMPQAIANFDPIELSTLPVYPLPILLSHQIPGIYQPGAEPWGQFPMTVGEKSVYAIDWTYWISFLWQPGFSATVGYVVRPFPWVGYEFICVTPGQTGNYPPVWPANAPGELVVDGSAIWQGQALSSASLQTSVVSAQYSQPTGMRASGYALQGNITPVLIDATLATPGQTYEIQCTAMMASGDFLVGLLVFDVN